MKTVEGQMNPSTMKNFSPNNITKKARNNLTVERVWFIIVFCLSEGFGGAEALS